MTHLNAILEACRALTGAGGSGVLGTVVRVTGSAYRRPGARMLFRDGAEPVGLVSGGCLEADLAERARELIAGGSPRTVVYDMRSPDDLVWGLGLGCGGEIRVLLETIGPGSPADRSLRDVAAARRARRSSAVATVLEVAGAAPVRPGDRLWIAGDGRIAGEIGDPDLADAIARDLRAALVAGRTSVVRRASPRATCDVLVEHVPTPIRLVVCGAGSDAVPVVRLAAGLGWEVVVLDHRPARARPERFPEAHEVRCVDFSAVFEVDVDARTPVLLMTHHVVHDRLLLARFLDSAAPYVGVLGPRRRTDILLGELERDGRRPDAGDLARLYAPVGLDVGSETPEEIALSAIAEVRAVLAARDGGPLRERRAPLHAGGASES